MNEYENGWGYGELIKREFEEFEKAAVEAVEVLEDQSERSVSALLHLYNAVADERADIGRAALEAVEVLEDMYEQSDAEAERYFRKWMDEYSGHYRTKGALRDAEAKIAKLHFKLEQERFARFDAEGDLINLRNRLHSVL